MDRKSKVVAELSNVLKLASTTAALIAQNLRAYRAMP